MRGQLEILKLLSLLKTLRRPRGGTGRHSRLKICGPSWHPGSSPGAATIYSDKQIIVLPSSAREIGRAQVRALCCDDRAIGAAGPDLGAGRQRACDLPYRSA